MPRGRVPAAGYLVADGCRQITVRQVPPPGGRTGLQWGQPGATSALVTIEHGDNDVVMLRYRYRDVDTPLRATTQKIKLARDRRHFGGAQRYFVCPDCGRWAWKLYDTGIGRFACRHCGKLTHQSQREGSWVRALRRGSKIRRYLSGSGNLSDPFPPRPAKMTLRIYECLHDEARQLEALPPQAWLQAGTKNIRLGIRRNVAGASRRQWWPGRSGRSEPERSSG